MFSVPELKLAGFEAALGNDAWQLAEETGQRLRLRVRVHEDPRTPGIEPEREKGVFPLVETLLALRAGGALRHPSRP